MKCKFLGFIFLFSIINLTFAQVKNGDYLIGGTFYYTFSNGNSTIGVITTSYPVTNQFIVSPGAAYFVRDFLAIGIGISESYTHSAINDEPNSGDVYDLSSSLLSVGPFVRYYFANSESWHLWIDANAGIGFGGAKQNQIVSGIHSDYAYEILNWSVGVNPGATMMVGKKMGIEINYGRLGFSHVKQTQTEPTILKSNRNTFGINWGYFGFGIVFHL